MRHFYELHDDMNIIDRWTLGDLIDPNGAPIDDRSFTAGTSVIDVSQVMRWGDYQPTSLDDVVDGDAGSKLLQLRRLIASCEVEVLEPGRAFNCTMSDMLVAQVPIADAFARVSPDEIQRFPTRIRGRREPYEIVNLIRRVACIDDQRSNFTKWTKDDHRADLAGEYREVLSLKLDLSSIPDDAHIFRLKGWEVTVVVDDKLKAAMESAGVEGMEFRCLTRDAN